MIVNDVPNRSHAVWWNQAFRIGCKRYRYAIENMPEPWAMVINCLDGQELDFPDQKMDHTQPKTRDLAHLSGLLAPDVAPGGMEREGIDI
jgi:hypothetical protein